MKYGYFDDLKKEYLITTPGTLLPAGSLGYIMLLLATGGCNRIVQYV